MTTKILLLVAVFATIIISGNSAESETEVKAAAESLAESRLNEISPVEETKQASKRHHLSGRSKKKKSKPSAAAIFGPSDSSSFPANQFVRFHQPQTNFDSDRNADTLTQDEEPNPQPKKFRFSPIQMKLVPLEEAGRDDSILKNLGPDISSGRIGYPEFISDAKNSADASTKPKSMFKFTPIFHHRISSFENSDESQEKEKPQTQQSGAIAGSNLQRIPKFKSIRIYVKRVTKRPEVTSTTEAPAAESSEEEDENAPEPIKEEIQEEEPRCPGPSDLVTGTKNFWNGFSTARSWTDSFKAIGSSFGKAASSVGSCFKSAWRGIKSGLGFQKAPKKKSVPQKKQEQERVEEDVNKFDDVPEAVVKREIESEGEKPDAVQVAELIDDIHAAVAPLI